MSLGIGRYKNLLCQCVFVLSVSTMENQDQWTTMTPPNVTVIGNTTYCWSDELQSYTWCQTEQLYPVPISKSSSQSKKVFFCTYFDSCGRNRRKEIGVHHLPTFLPKVRLETELNNHCPRATCTYIITVQTRSFPYIRLL